MATGTVKHWDERKAFGFILPDDPGDEDAFVHISKTVEGRALVVGSRVRYNVRAGRDGRPGAIDVSVI